MLLHIREMTEADVDAVSAVRVRGWQTAYAGIVPPSYLDRMTVEDDARRRRSWFARSRGRVTDLVAVAVTEDDDADVVGWASFGPYRADPHGADAAAPAPPPADMSAPAPPPPDTSAAELYALYVRPHLTGRGIGRALLDAVHARAAADGHRSVLLWALTANSGAHRFYSRAGYAPDGVTQSDAYDGVLLTETRYRRALAGVRTCPGGAPSGGPVDVRSGPVIGPDRIETERLVLRPLTAADVEAFVDLHADARVNRFVGAYSRTQAVERLAGIERQWAERGHGLCAVELRSSGEFIGRCGLQYWEQFDEVECGWTLRPESWGHGYATEAARACLRWGFETLGNDYFTAMIRPGNTPSVRVAERLGFSPRREDVLGDNPVTVYALDRSAGAS